MAHVYSILLAFWICIFIFTRCKQKCKKEEADKKLTESAFKEAVWVTNDTKTYPQPLGPSMDMIVRFLSQWGNRLKLIWQQSVPNIISMRWQQNHLLLKFVWLLSLCPAVAQVPKSKETLTLLMKKQLCGSPRRSSMPILAAPESIELLEQKANGLSSVHQCFYYSDLCHADCAFIVICDVCLMGNSKV